jgi:hypothetical protein
LVVGARGRSVRRTCSKKMSVPPSFTDLAMGMLLTMPLSMKC